MSKIFFGEKYLYLHNDNDFKKLSLEDNVYFTLRDLFLNADSNDCFIVNNFNSLLTNNISYEERDEFFIYTDKLIDKEYVTKLYNYLLKFKKSHFDTEIANEDDNINDYIKFDIWWDQFENLRNLLKIRLNNL
jgi:hypothetical protein